MVADRVSHVGARERFFEGTRWRRVMAAQGKGPERGGRLRFRNFVELKGTGRNRKEYLVDFNVVVGEMEWLFTNCSRNEDGG